MFNLFKTKKEKINLNEDEKMFVKVGEDEIELTDLIKFVEEKEDKKKFAEDDMMIELNGESITVKELVEKYNACKKNEEKKEEIKEEKKEEIKNEDHKEDEKDNEEIKEEKIEKKEEIKDNEEKIEEEKEEKKEEIKDNEEKIEEEKEEKKEIKNSIDLRSAYLNRGSEPVKLNGYLTIQERMELAHKKYGISK